MQLVVVSSFNLAITSNGHIFSLLIVYFSIITLNKGNVDYYYREIAFYYDYNYFGEFSIYYTITITGKSGYYILQLHIT